MIYNIKYQKLMEIMFLKKFQNNMNKFSVCCFFIHIHILMNFIFKEKKLYKKFNIYIMLH